MERVDTADTHTEPVFRIDVAPYRVYGADRPRQVLVVCEHASAHIPAELDDLGLEPRHRHSHAAWDIGAEALSARLAERLEAPLIVAGLSRLLLDLNRPVGAPDSIPSLVEVVEVPRNRDVPQSEREARAAALYHPFHGAVADRLDAMETPVLVTVHSFTPVWHGTPRETRIGLLHDADPTLARAMLARARDGAGVELNAPYSAADGVTHTIALHGTARGIPNVMIEVRNDLLGDEAGTGAIADELLEMLLPAIEEVA